MKRKVLAVCLIFAMLIPMGTVFSTDIFGDLYYTESGFYLASQGIEAEIDTIAPGTIQCRYVVTNDTQATKDITVLAGLFENGTLTDISYKTKTLAASESSMFVNTITVSQEDVNPEIRVYVVRDIDIGTPLVQVMSLNEKSNKNEVEEFSIDGANADINLVSKRMELKVPFSTDLSNCTPQVKVSQGASYQLSGSDFSQPVILTVTAENGEACEYVIDTKKNMPESASVSYDFEDDTIGEMPASTSWKIDGTNNGEAIVAADPEDSANKVVKVEDTSTAGAVTLSYSMDKVYYPLQVEFRIRFGHEGSYSKPDRDASFSMASIGTGTRPANSIGGIAISESASSVKWVCRTGQGDGTYKDQSISDSSAQINKWYQIKMIYRTDYMVEYYVDETLLTILPANALEEAGSVFCFVSSSGRCSYAYLDDLKISHMEEEMSAGYQQNFETMTAGEAPSDSWTTTGTAVVQDGNDGKVLSLTGGTAKRAITKTQNGASLEFDMCVNPSGTDAEVASVALGGDGAGLAIRTDAEGKLVLQNRTGSTYIIEDVELDAGSWHHMQIALFTDASTKQPLAAIFVDGAMVCAAIGSEAYLQADSVTFSAPSGQTVMLDNIAAGEF